MYPQNAGDRTDGKFLKLALTKVSCSNPISSAKLSISVCAFSMLTLGAGPTWPLIAALVCPLSALPYPCPRRRGDVEPNAWGAVVEKARGWRRWKRHCRWRAGIRIVRSGRFVDIVADWVFTDVARGGCGDVESLEFGGKIESVHHHHRTSGFLIYIPSGSAIFHNQFKKGSLRNVTPA